MKFRRDHMETACATARRLAADTEYHEQPCMASPLLTVVLIGALVALVVFRR